MKYAHIAETFANWNDHFNTDGEMAQAEFDAMTVEQRVALLVLAFGPEIADAVTIGSWTGSMENARNLMDDEICEQIHSTVETDQEFVDAYLPLHEEKYRAEFAVN